MTKPNSAAIAQLYIDSAAEEKLTSKADEKDFEDTASDCEDAQASFETRTVSRHRTLRVVDDAHCLFRKDRVVHRKHGSQVHVGALTDSMYEFLLRNPIFRDVVTSKPSAAKDWVAIILEASANLFADDYACAVPSRRRRYLLWCEAVNAFRNMRFSNCGLQSAVTQLPPLAGVAMTATDRRAGVRLTAEQYLLITRATEDHIQALPGNKLLVNNMFVCVDVRSRKQCTLQHTLWELHQQESLDDIFPSS